MTYQDLLKARARGEKITDAELVSARRRADREAAENAEREAVAADLAKASAALDKANEKAVTDVRGKLAPLHEELKEKREAYTAAAKQEAAAHAATQRAAAEVTAAHAAMVETVRAAGLGEGDYNEPGYPRDETGQAAVPIFTNFNRLVVDGEVIRPMSDVPAE